MFISRLKIVNYRSCIDVDVPLGKYSILVGYNNAGKSNILNALDWLLNPAVLAEKDFYDINQDIVVYGVIQNINQSLLDKIDESHRSRIEPYITENSLIIKRVLDHNNLSKRGISLYVTKELRDTFETADWDNNPTGIDNAIRHLFPDTIKIPAMSDAVEDATKFATKTTMGQLIGKIIDEFKNRHETEINNSLSEIREIVGVNGVNRSEDLEKIDNLITNNIAGIFPGINAKVHIELPTINDIFKGATLRTTEDGTMRDLSYLGHGTQRSIQMALIRSLSDISEVESESSITTILIEEPELYLHPYAIELTRQALSSLGRSRYQVIVVTHSPLVITADDMPDVVMVRKDPSVGTIILETVRNQITSSINDMPSQTEVLFSLSNKTNILFSEKVLLVEGRTEQRILPKIFEKLRESTLAACGIALVPQAGVDNTTKSLKILCELGLEAFALADLDFVFRGAITNGIIEASDSRVQRLLALLRELSEEHHFLLDEAGLPKKGNGKSASACYRILAQVEDAKSDIESINVSLLENGIWIWTKGDIEAHLGLQGKNEKIWSIFLQQIETHSIDEVAPDSNEITKFVEWICS